MRILASALGISLILLAFFWFKSDSEKQARQAAEAESAQLKSFLEDQRGEAIRQADLLVKFDQSLTRLAAETLENNQKLAKTLDGIDRLEKTEGDSDESFSCLDLPVPRGLDDSLR